jgi:hypothetical protein
MCRGFRNKQIPRRQLRSIESGSTPMISKHHQFISYFRAAMVRVASSRSIHSSSPRSTCPCLYFPRPAPCSLKVTIPNIWLNHERSSGARSLLRAAQSCRPVCERSPSKRSWLMGGHGSSSQTPSIADPGLLVVFETAAERAAELDVKRQSPHNRP